MILISETTGTVDFTVGSETYQTWYKVVGNMKESGLTPLVIANGVPASRHSRMSTCAATLGFGKRGISPSFSTTSLAAASLRMSAFN